ncbi:MAG: GNAT family N-acetyltransferase [Candidatus Marinimicrobia bacterium]|nr:GNAT family N-acetyltransferase [Candidatus Neomarinimicrobiota bacterium]
MTTYFTEILNPTHRKKEFSCGKSLLDSYLHKQAGQDVKRKLSACFVLNDSETNLIQGYYTLSNTNIPLNQIPESFRKKLPKSYKHIPATLLGRLAIDTRYQGKGSGKILLIDALKRSFENTNTIASFAVIVDPLDKEAQYFYKKYGFILLPGSGKMFLAMTTIKTLFK